MFILGGAFESIDRIKKKRAGKRKSVPSPIPSLDDVEASPSASPNPLPPSFSSTQLGHTTSNSPGDATRGVEDDSVAVMTAEEEKARLHLEESQAPPSLDDAETAPPPYQAPPYERHRSDVLLESSQPQRSSRPSRRPRGLFPARANTISVPESSAAAREAERQGRRPCRVGSDGRCECGKRERSPNAPLGETIKERRDRKWKEMWSLDNPGFWGLLGVSLASHGGAARVWDDKTQFRYWKEP